MPLARICDANDSDAVREAAAVIARGGLVAFPTETVYGLGANALDARAVARVFEVKARPHIDPLIVHVDGLSQARECGDLDKAAEHLVERFWPGPLTLVVRKRERIPLIVTAGLETVALRMPHHPAALALIGAAGTPIAAPSANLFGEVSPTEARHVAETLGSTIDLILDGGKCAIGVESTILSLVNPLPVLLRPGGMPVEELEQLLGPIERVARHTGRPMAPGQMERHYATRTPLEILVAAPEEAPIKTGERLGLLAWTRRDTAHGRYAAIETLSPSGDLREAAANLFAALRALDRLGLDRLVAEPVPETGLGIAIMDRLRRCAAR